MNQAYVSLDHILTSICLAVCGPHVDIYLCVFCLIHVCENVCADIQCKHTVYDCMSACVFLCVCSVWSVEASGCLTELC